MSRYGGRTRSVQSSDYLPSNADTAWVRPSDWPALPELQTTDQKFVGLIGVWNTNANAVAVLADTSTGTYTVDWGDGTIDSGITKNTAQAHQYTYSSLSSSVTSEGFKTAIVTITPDSGNLTTINLQQRPSTYTYAASSDPGWLDIAIAGTSITTLRLGSGSATSGSTAMTLGSLERARIISSNLTSAGYLFYNCYALESVEINTGTLTSTANMFAYCYSLQVVPLFNTSSVTDMSSMFFGCYNLRSVPLFNTANVTSMSSMFASCVNLRSIPLFNTANVTSMSSMLSSCLNLQSVPLFNTVKVTSMSSMFQSCYVLRSVPLFNTSNVTSMSSMFASCYSLKTVPLFDTVKVNTMSSMFTNCFGLTAVPAFNTPALTNTQSTFAGCSTLRYVPFFNTSGVSACTQTFLNCYSLSSLPALSWRSVTASTNMTGIVSGCYSLSSAPFVGARYSHSFANCRLNASALDAIYANLADNNAYTVTGASWSGGTTTYTIGTHYMAVGQSVTITGSTPTAYNVTSGAVTAVTATTFSVARASDPGTWTSGGTIAANASQIITVTNNYGTTGHTTSIATNKGWQVTV